MITVLQLGGGEGEVGVQTNLPNIVWRIFRINITILVTNCFLLCLIIWLTCFFAIYAYFFTPERLQYYIGGYGQKITILHRGGSGQKITILHREGGVYRDPQKWLRNLWMNPKTLIPSLMMKIVIDFVKTSSLSVVTFHRQKTSLHCIPNCHLLVRPI